MNTANDLPQTMTSDYEAEILAWQQAKYDDLTSEDGWLTLSGLYWLHVGDNSIGSDPGSDVALPAGAAPDHLGTIHFDGSTTRLTVMAGEPVFIDGEPVADIVLHNDQDGDGPSLVKINALTFYLIRRGDESAYKYGIRIKDRNSEDRRTFKGRHWFPIDPSYRIATRLVRHSEPRSISVTNTGGIPESIENPGYVEFTLNGETFRLEAFWDNPETLWFIFRDAAAGDTTYGMGRFLKVPINAADEVDLDFNLSYNPPCAFTRYAACPMPPKQNILPIRIEVGERKPLDGDH